MLYISDDAEKILQTYRDDYVDYKTPQEYGRSAFWNWYYQVRNNIYSLDRENLNDGYNQIFSMNYWGDIIYSKKTFSNGYFLVVVEDFKFDDDNLANWLNHAPLNEKPFTKKLNKEEIWVNKEREENNPFPNGKPIHVSGFGGFHIYKNHATNLMCVTDKKCTKYTHYSFTHIQWFRDRSKPNVIAKAIDVTNNEWLIDKNCHCTKVVNEELNNRLSQIITEVLSKFIYDNLLIA